MAACYDGLLLACVLLLASMLFYLIAGKDFSFNPIVRGIFQLYLLLTAFLFYGWFWTHGGQTLGMRAWRLRVLQYDQQPITWRQAFIRYHVALLSWLCLGMGFLWVLIDSQRRAWHDRLSGTQLVLLPKR